MAMTKLLLALLLLFLGLSEGTSPSFAGRIANKGQDNAHQEGVAVLKQWLSKLTLPDFSGTNSVPVVGDVQYKFHSLNIQNFELPSSEITFNSKVGLRMSITDAFAHLTGNWEWKKWSSVKSHGLFDLKADGISISFGLKPSVDTSGRPSVTASDCNAQVANVQVQISGSKLSWLYNLFNEKIASTLKAALESQVCGVVSSSASSIMQPFL